MPRITYFIRYALRSSRPGTPYEEQEYTTLSNAWEAIRLFIEPDSADLYTRIELTAFDWENDEEHLIVNMDFAKPQSF